MFIWKNTATLDGYDDGLIFTQSKKEAEIALLGSKSININEFPNLKGIFRAGIGRDNVPEKEAFEKGVLVKFPSQDTINIIYEETANFTCGLIFRMLYDNIGSLNPWVKNARQQLSKKLLLVIGIGNVGGRVAERLKHFMKVSTFDILHNEQKKLQSLITVADCVTLHIQNNEENQSFMDLRKLSWMKNGASLINTARGSIVDENALYNEIKNGRLKAAFDVFWHEPYEGKLKEFYPDYFYMTPHVASTCIDFLKGCRIDLIQFINNLNSNGSLNKK